MARVKIITDSTADIPPALAQELNITVIPIHVHFGDQTLRAGIDISNEQFYRRMAEGGPYPYTTAPAPGVFEQYYRQFSREYDGVFSIHLSNRFGGVVKSATIARDKLPASLTRVEVIDSTSTSLGLGMVAIAAARAALDGASLDEVHRTVMQTIQLTHVVFFVDSIDYLERSGRLSQASAMLGSMQRIKPLLILDDGEIVPYDRTRTRAKAIEGLFTFIEDFPKVEQVAIMHSTTPDDVEKLLEKIDPIYPRDQVMIVEYGPALGAHLGPNAMGVVVYEGVE
ncbi:DegV family protein [Herpetosiphon llansteffanensis]|uniref:DegV family protein n=1 Tax=Herpetosiphon llansteffanensis TaxID=2094568 RepID=UPI000D7BE2A1|nr:DegV family protein [Herpetosiphon llansteffanensis]